MAEPKRQPKEMQQQKVAEVREGPWGQAITTPAAMLPVSHISWSSIFAGLTIALITQILLSAIGATIGLSIGTGRAVTTTVGVWTAISGLIALFFGGWIAARMAAIGSMGTGVIHGILVWALFFITAIIFASAGAISAIGVLTPPVAITPGQATIVSSFALLGMALSLAAAIIGGLIGGVSRMRQMERQTTGQ